LDLLPEGLAQVLQLFRCHLPDVHLAIVRHSCTLWRKESGNLGLGGPSASGCVPRLK
jgi:hypothetical protein